MDVQITAIVAAQYADTARRTAEALTPAGHNMFTTGLSPDGNEPATHYISAGLGDVMFWHLLASPHTLYYAATQGAQAQGIEYTCTLDDVVEAFSAADLSNDEPHGRIATMGLQLVNQDEYQP